MKPDQRAAKIRFTLEQFQQSYQSQFAGQPRLSRDPRILDMWIARAEELIPQCKTLPKAAQTALLKTINDRISLYKKEAAAIRLSQKLNEASQAAYRYIEWSKLGTDRYERHFAGQSRNTRDSALLSELIVDAKLWVAKSQKHLSDHEDEFEENAKQDLEAEMDRLKERVVLYEGELKAIASAQSDGDSTQQSDLLAYLANQNFILYRAHFGGHPRNSRRLETLERVTSNLDAIRNHMKRLHREGLDTERHLQNLKVVEHNLKSYRAEEEKIQSTQNSMSYDQWIEALSEGAQKVHAMYQEEFAGKNRSTCDPVLLNVLCDQLYDLAYQMRPFIQSSPHPEERSLLQNTLDQFRVYHREYLLVSEAVKERGPNEQIH
jgi:hypothetical protein